jgi:hypothetical protein
MTKKTILAVLAIACLLPMCGAKTGNGRIAAEVTDAGTFELGPGKPGTRESHFTAQGDVFTARLGLKFGFRFILRNVPGATIDLQTAVTHPPFPDKAGVIRTHYELITTVHVTDGSASGVTGYSFDRPEEMAVGVWTFEHSYHGKTLVKQSFRIRAPRP